MADDFLEAVKVRMGPFYKAWIATLAALFFGLGPILCAWVTFAVHGKFLAHYAATLGNGDALMIASSLAGPALVLAFKRRDPETMGAPQLMGLIGLGLVFASVVVFMNASPNSAIGGGPLEEQRVLTFTYILLPASVLYALWISYLDERSNSLRDFNKVNDTNGSKLNISFSGGSGNV
ncbi:hypothetical protein [Terriglobus saanensis]|uniref:Uncharacterized protein n=1 Tax=Terriglobus saanensis (strain ATCC BAA-1853 / DSM 23119 / SP1PR4) TaxID=401053 RepID=E8UXC2_TERSS|nr:hypothetical protein [Terriglobus saanensis]ADV84146.1 hypothetical protein AciPR4_3392 [Terriglobus saanensis SP1PR4]